MTNRRPHYKALGRLSVAGLCLAMAGGCASLPGANASGLETAYQGALALDMLQTRDIRRHAGLVESNPMLGDRPSDARIAAYWAASAALHYAVSQELLHNAPLPIYNAWEYVTIGLEAGCVYHNATLGVRVRF